MYALSFDMEISDLKKYYGEPYNAAYYEIKQAILKRGFRWIQGSTYMLEKNDMAVLFGTINDLKAIDWFSKSVRDLRGYKVEDWSDFTAEVKR